MDKYIYKIITAVKNDDPKIVTRVGTLKQYRLDCDRIQECKKRGVCCWIMLIEKPRSFLSKLDNVCDYAVILLLMAIAVATVTAVTMYLVIS